MTGARNSIGITVPDSSGGYVVFVNTVPPSHTLNRRFASHELAWAHALELAAVTELPVIDANIEQPDRYGQHQGAPNRYLLLMAEAATATTVNWDAADFWANAALTHAQVLAEAARYMSSLDLAASIGLGGAMLRLAADDLGFASPHEVLGFVMIVEGEA